MVNKIVSGAQTGADRGGIDAAIEMNIAYGGLVAKGRNGRGRQSTSQIHSNG